MQIKFNNGVTVDVLSVNGSSRYFQGANRDSLEIQIAREAIDFEGLEELTADSANTKKLVVIDGEAKNTFDDYVFRAELSLRPVTVSASVTPDAPDVAEERYSVVLAQKTYTEQQIDRLNDTVDALVLSAL